MALSDRMLATSLRLLQQYGESISITRDSTGAYAPSTGTVTDNADTTYTGYGYPTTYRINERDNTLIQANDIRLILRSDTTPLIGDIVLIRGVKYTTINVEKISVQGVNIIYKLQLRQ